MQMEDAMQTCGNEGQPTFISEVCWTFDLHVRRQHMLRNIGFFMPVLKQIDVFKELLLGICIAELMWCRVEIRWWW